MATLTKRYYCPPAWAGPPVTAPKGRENPNLAAALELFRRPCVDSLQNTGKGPRWSNQPMPRHIGQVFVGQVFVGQVFVGQVFCRRSAFAGDVFCD
jgi:hypothetical protein